MSLLRDERGKLSMARGLLLLNTLFIMFLIVLDATHGWHIGTSIWSLLSSMELSFIAWAGGTRLMQYLGPQAVALVQSVTAGKSTERIGGARAAHFDVPESPQP